MYGLNDVSAQLQTRFFSDMNLWNVVFLMIYMNTELDVIITRELEKYLQVVGLYEDKEETCRRKGFWGVLISLYYYFVILRIAQRIDEIMEIDMGVEVMETTVPRQRNGPARHPG
ncbi:hypothetical protein Bca101_093262 [Brassica carinata]